MRVSAEVQRLHAATRAEVERCAYRFTGHRLGEGEGGGADAEHVVGRQRRTAHVRAEVGDQPTRLIRA